MERFVLACGACLTAASLILPLGCGSAFTAASSTGPDGGTDALAPIDGAPTEGGSTDGTVPEGAAGEGGTPGEGGLEASGPLTVVYVSSTGDDSNVGTDPALPKKTIAQGLVEAQAIGAAASVEVCKGTYPETSLTLVLSIPLRGGYDCSSWTRTLTYGYPGFDGANTTLIENGTPNAQAATLVVTGGAAAAEIDGFAIAGATVSTSPTVAIEVLGLASPVIANDVFSGGGGVGGASNAGSIGVDILGGSAEVRFCLIGGGSGTGNPGSVGVAVTSTGSPYVHDDIISGGTGAPTSATSDLASVGVLAKTSLTQATALKDLVVSGSDAPAMGSTAGMVVSGTGLSVDIEASAIHGGTGSLAGTVSEGLAVDNAGGMTRVLGDRIYGGDRTGASSQTYGVQVVAVGSLSVSNTEIHAGTVAATTGAFSMGIDVASASALNVTFDTVYSGQGSGAALAVGTGISGAVVTDDLFAGGGSGTSATAVQMGSCSGELAALDYTAFVNFADLYSCPGDMPPTSITALATALPGVTTTGDIELQSTALCTAATSCVPDSSCPAAPAVCLPSLFGASWTADDGVTGLFDGPPVVADAAAPQHGWSLLGASIPCALARGGTPVGGDATDLFGVTRDPSKPTIGAAEYTPSNCAN